MVQRYKRSGRASRASDDDELHPDPSEDPEIEADESINRFDAVIVILSLALLAAMIFLAATK